MELVFKCEEFKKHGFGLIFIFTSEKTAPTFFFELKLKIVQKRVFFIFFSIEKQLKNVFFEFTLKNWFSGLKMYHSDIRKSVIAKISLWSNRVYMS